MLGVYKKLLPVIVVILIIAVLIIAWQFGGKEAPTITNFADCIAVGNPVMESYPRQCQADGQIFVENIGNELEKTDMIRLDTPRPNQIIKSPLTIKGEARGFWFSEGGFPVVFTDGDGQIVSEGLATAQGDWMTEDFVPFRAILKIEFPEGESDGTLILKKGNPSGLPQNNDTLEIPVLIAASDNVGGILPFNSGMTGVVLLGPICPVAPVGDKSCADKPYVTKVLVMRAGSTKISPFVTAKTDKQGRYKVELPPGKYSVQAVGGSPLPYCEAKSVTIKSNEMLAVNFSCDTGIR